MSLFLYFSSSNMPRMRGANGRLLPCCSLWEHASKTPIEAKVGLYTINLLHEYGIAPRKLYGFSWWIALSYFINYHHQNEVSKLIIFQSLYLLKRTIGTGCGKTQLKRLLTRSSLIIEDLFNVRNVFLYCLEGCSPNGYRSSDSRKVTKALGVVVESWSWPHEIYGNFNNND
ncbi:hypothetical protein J1N35_005352 [Gossypium stocksii]|uniref:Uncharacterized protein n=1 Tax=Gossypium stocksii TaxID=47602 RepID=A0A9D4AH04_9ROSI|nr:hypothetical protein J1N35_005352 [Gossypium stocksii]